MYFLANLREPVEDTLEIRELPTRFQGVSSGPAVLILSVLFNKLLKSNSNCIFYNALIFVLHARALPNAWGCKGELQHLEL